MNPRGRETMASRDKEVVGSAVKGVGVVRGGLPAASQVRNIVACDQASRAAVRLAKLVRGEAFLEKGPNLRFGTIVKGGQVRADLFPLKVPAQRNATVPKGAKDQGGVVLLPALDFAPGHRHQGRRRCLDLRAPRQGTGSRQDQDQKNTQMLSCTSQHRVYNNPLSGAGQLVKPVEEIVIVVVIGVEISTKR